MKLNLNGQTHRAVIKTIIGDPRQLPPIKPTTQKRIKKRKAKKISYRAKRKLRNKRAAQSRKFNRS